MLLPLSIAMLVLASAARADWPPLAGPGVPVCEPPANPNLITSATDGSGGMIVSWLDARGGSAGYRVYARRISGDGVPLWTDGGVQLNAARTSTERPATVSDFAGGAIVVWRDFRADTAGDLYAQRLHADGTPVWAANGIAVTNGPLHETKMTAVGDGAGGVVVAWTDDRTGVLDVRVQHVDASGAPLWPMAGVGVAPPASTLSDKVALAADYSGGVFVGWTALNGTHFSPYIQHLDPLGSSLWTAGGVLASTGAVANGVALVGLAADGTGGVLAALSDDRSQNSWRQAFGQRVDASGNVAWAADGVSLSGPAWPVYEQFAIADLAGGGIFAWRRYENGGGINGIYAQRVSAAGSTLWGPGAVLVAHPIEGNGMEGMRAVPDGVGGAVLAWNSQRSISELRPFDVLAQRLGPAGNALWAPGGQRLASSDVNALYQTTLVPVAPGRRGRLDRYAELPRRVPGLRRAYPRRRHARRAARRARARGAVRRAVTRPHFGLAERAIQPRECGFRTRAAVRLERPTRARAVERRARPGRASRAVGRSRRTRHTRARRALRGLARVRRGAVERTLGGRGVSPR
jgi:hypothetical protein